MDLVSLDIAYDNRYIFKKYYLFYIFSNDT